MKRYVDYWTTQYEWWGSRRLEWWVAHLTALYVGATVLIMAARFDELICLKLNELGDLSAGVFGPVAFLWLVLGYIQQGRELQISSKALQMQTAELKASVEQQTALAQAQKENLRQNEFAFSPILELKYVGMQDHDGEFFDHFSLINHGAYCDCVTVTLFDGGIEKHSYNLDFIFKDVSRGFLLDCVEGLFQRFKVEATYKQLNGADGVQTFDVRVFQSEQGHSVQVSKYLA